MGRGPYVASKDSFMSCFNEGIQLSLFEGRDWVDLTVGWLRVGNELDRVVPCPAFWERVQRFSVKDRFEVAHPLRKPILTGCRVLSVCFHQLLQNGTGGADVFRRRESSVKDPVPILNRVILVIRVVRVVW